jgi:hypothetical protein
MVKKLSSGWLKKLRSGWLALLAGMLVISIIVVSFLTTITAGIRWIIVLVLMVGFVIAIGKKINGRALGILINEYNAMSLSRFQMIVWTLIIVSAYFTIASARISAGAADPLGIAIDWQLWALIGISSTSLVGTPLILHDKEQRAIAQKLKSKQERANVIAQITGKAPKIVTLLVKEIPKLSDRTSTDNAEFSDIFKADEKPDGTAHVDMSKVQMFFFTIISAISYIVLLYNLINTTPTASSLPVLPPGLIALLTISHGAYLTNKAVPPKPSQ